MKRRSLWRVFRLAPRIACALALIMIAASLLTPYLVRYTYTQAKFISKANTTGTAQVAKFSFVTNSTPFGTGNQQGAANKQFVVSPGQSNDNTFTIPLFDTRYVTPPPGADWFNGPASSIETVISRNGNLIAAPGTGTSFGPGADSTVAHTITGDGWMHKLQFRNESEVTVRYRVTVDSIAGLRGVPLYLYVPENGKGWAPSANGWALTGNASDAWITLPPNMTTWDTWHLGWFWLYDATGYVGYPYGSSLAGYINSEGWVPNSDEDDTYLGWLGAEYLRGNVGLDAASMKLALKLEVVQVD